MPSDKKLTVDDLWERADDWALYAGDRYWSSSELRLNSYNKQGRPNEALFMASKMDTQHDLLDFNHFVDFMSARAKQADALASDLQDYKAFSQEHPGFGYISQDGEWLISNYGERYVMAMYGVDEKAHHGRFTAQLNAKDEWPYEMTRMGVSQRACETRPGYTESIDELCENLKAFSSEWNDILAAEQAARAKSDKALIGVSFDGGDKREVEFFTKDMAVRYASEIAGRGAYFDRTCALHEYSPDAVLGHMMVKCDDAEIRDELAYISILTRNQFGEIGKPYGAPDKYQAYALDSRSIVAKAEHDMSQLSAEMQAHVRDEFKLEPENQDKPEAGNTRPDRDVSDLDSACENIKCWSDLGISASGDDMMVF